MHKVETFGAEAAVTVCLKSCGDPLLQIANEKWRR